MSDEKVPAINEKHLNAPDETTVATVFKAAVGVVKDDAAKYGVEHCCVREYWAVVERNGTLVRGRNVMKCTRLSTGIYEILFTGDVSQGVFVATIGRPGIATEPPGDITVALRCCQPSPFTNKGIWVDTRDPNGKYSDRAFHLIVLTQD